MNQVKTGMLIRQLRTEQGLTQKQLAERIGVGDKAVSKLECGNGCPDISLLAALAEVFATDMQVLLSGEIGRNEKEKGNMKKTKFYVCPKCGNLVTAAAGAGVTCCGSKLTALEPRRAEPEEMLRLEEIDGEWYVTARHEMAKEHYISFVAYIRENTMLITRQYPEWNLECRLPLYHSGRLVWYCTQCGLLCQDVK